MNMHNFPKIYIGEYSNDSMINIIDTLPLPSNTVFGNLCLKYMSIIERVAYANQKIDIVILQHIAFKTQGSLRPISYLFVIEEIVFLLRRVSDELISLLWLLDNWVQKNKCAQKLEIDCIGGVFAEKNKNFLKKYFGGSLRFLKNLNDISNAYKHSFINSDLHAIAGDDEPVVNALELPRNDLRNIDRSDIGKRWHSIYLRDIINGFNEFFEDIRINLENLNNQIKPV